MIGTSGIGDKNIDNIYYQYMYLIIFCIWEDNLELFEAKLPFKWLIIMSV